MFKKLLNLSLLTLLFDFNNYQNLTFNNRVKNINNTKNFAKDYSLLDKEVHQNESGYFYYSCNVYSFDFTSSKYVNSKIFMICTDVNFTPGSIAKQNGDSSFDSGYGLNSGYVHVGFKSYEREELQARTSSFVLKDATPENTTFNRTITTSYGGSYNYSSAVSGEINLDNGVAIKNSKSSGVNLTFDRSVAISSSEPTISKQLANNNANEIQWSYQFSNKHNNSFSLKTISFLEVLDNGYGYSPYSFGFDISIKMENYKVGFFWIKTTKVTETSVNIMIGSLL